MSKMSFHVPFEYLKHKLWSKERLGIKVSIWFSTIKSRKSLIYLCVGDVSHIVGNFLTRARTFLRPHFNLRFAQKVMSFQSCENVNFKNFGIPNLGVLGQNDIWVQALWLGTKNTIRGKVVTSPKFGPWWVLWICVCMWLACAPKFLQPRTNQLVVWSMQIHVNNWLACHLS